MAKKRTRKLTFTAAIRKAIEESGLSRYRISKETGIAQSTLSRFMIGETGLSTTSLDKLSDVLGLEVVVRRKKRS